MKRIELTSRDEEILYYVYMNHKKMAEEIKSKGIGSYISESNVYNTSGFQLNLGDVSIVFLYGIVYGKASEIEILFKGRRIFKSQLPFNIENNFWTGKFKYLEVTDSYNRGEESRHDLELGFRYVMDIFEKDFYLPYLEDVKNQKLQDDLVYDEFEELIKINKK